MTDMSGCVKACEQVVERLKESRERIRQLDRAQTAACLLEAVDILCERLPMLADDVEFSTDPVRARDRLMVCAKRYEMIRRSTEILGSKSEEFRMAHERLVEMGNGVAKRWDVRMGGGEGGDALDVVDLILVRRMLDVEDGSEAYLIAVEEIKYWQGGVGGVCERVRSCVSYVRNVVWKRIDGIAEGFERLYEGERDTLAVWIAEKLDEHLVSVLRKLCEKGGALGGETAVKGVLMEIEGLHTGEGKCGTAVQVLQAVVLEARDVVVAACERELADVYTRAVDESLSEKWTGGESCVEVVEDCVRKGEWFRKDATLVWGDVGLYIVEKCEQTWDTKVLARGGSLCRLLARAAGESHAQELLETGDQLMFHLLSQTVERIDDLLRCEKINRMLEVISDARQAGIECGIPLLTGDGNGDALDVDEGIAVWVRRVMVENVRRRCIRVEDVDREVETAERVERALGGAVVDAVRAAVKERVLET